MKGFFKRILLIDLNEQRFSYEALDDDLLKTTLGGKGLGIHLLSTKNPVGVDPFSPRSVFVIATGPANGTHMWGSARFGVFGKSPLTGGYGESYCGGRLSARIKGCGVDAVVVSGRAERLSWCLIDEKGVRFNDASDLAGGETFTAEAAMLRQAPAGSAAMVIGPAGENRVRFACIKSDRWRSLGRGGFGAVLGAKNLKGMVFSGTMRCDIADTKQLNRLIQHITVKGKEAPVTELYKTLGTPMQVEVTNLNECFPTRYWRKGRFEHWEKISAKYMQAHFDVRAVGCPFCFLKCTKLSKIRHGRHTGLELEGPEYETIYALGGLNEVDSLEEIAWLNDRCDRLGLDTMSAGNMTAFAAEAYAAGAHDYKIEYNQPDRMNHLLTDICYRRGLGEVLAEGIKKAAETLGLAELAIHVKGMEPAGFEPRVLKGMGLSYATAARGACHLRGTFYKPELSGQIDRATTEGKAELLIDFEDRAALFDSLVLCRFFRDFILWDELGQLIGATTGLNVTQRQLAGIANSITRQTRLYNRREGLGVESDTLPVRFLQEATEEGAILKESELDTMIRDYNRLRGESA